MNQQAFHSKSKSSHHRRIQTDCLGRRYSEKHLRCIFNSTSYDSNIKSFHSSNVGKTGLGAAIQQITRQIILYRSKNGPSANMSLSFLHNLLILNHSSAFPGSSCSYHACSFLSIPITSASTSESNTQQTQQPTKFSRPSPIGTPYSHFPLLDS